MKINPKKLLVQCLHVAVHVGSFVPLAWLFWALPAGKFGGDPVEELIHFLGIGALRLLLLTLCITPLARYFRYPPLIRLRRPLGLWCFGWASVHFACWLTLDLGLMWGLIGEEIVKRTYILLGFSVWLILTALAVTSIPRLVKALGRRWKSLHRLIYPALILACVHFWWSVKSGWFEPAIYLTLALLLIAPRVRKLFPRRHL